MTLTIDIENHGYSEFLPCAISLVASDKANFTTIIDVLRPEDTGNILALTLALKRPLTKVPIAAVENLVSKLVENLAKNHRQLRLVTLRLIEHAFESLSFVDYDPEKHGHLCDLESATKNYRGPCPVISHLLKMESTAINIEHEKQKASCLRNVKVLIETGLVPELYLKATYFFLVGCLWIKFLPL